MMKLSSKIIALSLCTALLSGCAILPRGAGIEREILKQDENVAKQFAIYPVTKSFLPTAASWPATGSKRSDGWLGHKHGSGPGAIAAGDRLDLVIWDNENNSLLTVPGQKAVTLSALTVSSAGTVFLPYLYNVHVAGNSPEAARRKIQRQMEGIIPSAQVQLNRTEGQYNKADLVAGVGTSGSYPIMGDHFTLLNLISQGGGASPALRNPRVRLNRHGKSYVRSLSDVYENPELDPLIRGGDKVIVEQDDRYFLGLGATGKETQVFFPQEKVSALDAMALVGGVSDSRGNPAAILILRQYPEHSVRDGLRGPENARTIFTLDLTNADGLFSAGQFEIHPKDTVLVTESPINSAQTIFSLIGSVFGIAGAANNVGGN